MHKFTDTVEGKPILAHTNHTWGFCKQCGWFVRCGNCGNNCCNGGSKPNCSDGCREAYYLQSEWDRSTTPELFD